MKEDAMTLPDLVDAAWLKAEIGAPDLVLLEVGS